MRFQAGLLLIRLRDASWDIENKHFIHISENNLASSYCIHILKTSDYI